MLAILALFACTPDTSDSAGSDWVPNACGTWAGLQEDRVWTYTFADEAGATGEWSVEVGLFDGVAGRLTTQGSTTEPGVTRDYTDITEFTCEDGLSLLSVESSYAGLAEGTAYSGSSRTVYDPPARVWPADAKAGDAWDAEYVGTVQIDDGTPTALAYTVHNEVLGPVELEVAAGTFRAFPVRQTTGEGEAAVSSRVFVAAEVGVVKGQAYELASVR